VRAVFTIVGADEDDDFEEQEGGNSA
jgi:hypothetical protein